MNNQTDGVGRTQESCTWTNEGDDDYNDGRWATSCGNDFLLNEGSPTENRMVHCCYCGALLSEIRSTISD